MIPSLFQKGFSVTAFCPICHRPLHSIGVLIAEEQKPGEEPKKVFRLVGTCNQHGAVTPTKVIMKPNGRPLPDQSVAAAATSEKE